TVRSLCLSIAIIDAMGQGAQKARLAEHMARSFHAAVQARSFAIKRHDTSPEEVFIATLLCNIGDLAFWGLKSDAAPKLNEALQRPGVNRAQAEREVLGFELDELSLGLVRKWQLGSLLENTLENKGDSNPRVSSVRMAHELALKAEQGWDSPEVKQFLVRMSEALYLPLKDVTKLVHENASEAAKAAQYFGAGAAAERIPLPDSQRKASEHRPGAVLRADDAKPKFIVPDPMLQLTILRELSGMLDGQHDINLLLEMVLEGISRGIGMDRALFAMLNPERTRLRARYALGWDKDDMREKFLFDISPLKANIFSHALEARQPLWFGGPGADPRLAKLMTSVVLELTGDAQFFVMPVEINGRSIGLFYADRKSSERSLDEDSYMAFRHFCQQANLALAQSRRGR
ncbi:MAG: HDOD domain-containing protein, partial [Gammaproteobacteria bacterium]|nr:HDOD domain-containing protein [Gammaproteobacteria bacterium]